MAIAYISRQSKISIAVTTQPTTTEYIQGDTLDLTGIVVTATNRDGITEIVTSSCTFSPANGSILSNAGTTTITITYHGKTTTTSVTCYQVASIAVTTPPTKTTYNAGDTIDYTGIVVTATALPPTIQFTKDITSQCTFSPANGTTLRTGGTFNATITWSSYSTTQSYTVAVPIYGAEWAGGSSSAWTRTDDAANFGNPSPAVNNGSGSSPFDNIMPWSGMRRVEESTAYAVNQVLVEIPKFYYKWTNSGSAIKLQIANAPVSGFSVSPAHADRGDGKGERDYVYVGAYNTTKIGSFWYSVSGTTPTVSITTATARSGIHNTNSTQWQWDYAMYWTICMLYLVEYADWDSQRKIGKGAGNGSLTTTGQTDSMRYHTGTNVSARSTAGHVRYRYIEDLWANCFDWIDGFTSSSGYWYGSKNPSQFGKASSYVQVAPCFQGEREHNIKSWTVSSLDSFFMNWALVPSSVNTSATGASTSYCCDIYNYWGDGYPLVGGSFQDSSDGAYVFGLFCLSSVPDTSLNYVGCRLMKLP